jgi:hypothetical protein
MKTLHTTVKFGQPAKLLYPQLIHNSVLMTTFGTIGKLVNPLYIFQNKFWWAFNFNPGLDNKTASSFKKKIGAVTVCPDCPDHVAGMHNYYPFHIFVIGKSNLSWKPNWHFLGGTKLGLGQKSLFCLLERTQIGQIVGQSVSLFLAGISPFICEHCLKLQPWQNKRRSKNERFSCLINQPRF